MNTEHIISLARKAGWGFSNSRDSDFVKAQLCFAELVAAEEREACAKACDVIAQKMDDEGEGPTGNIGWVIDCAEAIRARNSK